MTSPLETYQANCHCGQIIFSISLPALPTTKIIRCNCSICTKNGYLLVYPKKEDVIFHSGEESLSSYLCGNKKRPHKFCGRCGTSILIDFSGTETEAERAITAVNIRTIVGIEDCLGELTFRDFDGKGNGPAYKVPAKI